MSTATVGFSPESFTWSDGAFVLTGDWVGDADGLGRVRLLVDVDGRQRNVGAQGGKTAGGADWRATFMCQHPPDPGTEPTLKVAEHELPLPAPELRAPDPPAEEAEAKSLIEQLRAERAAIDVARQRLAQERRAAEEVEARLAGLRRRAGTTPTTSQDMPALAYAVAAAIALLFLVMLVVVL